MRERRPGHWELRVYVGSDADSGRRLYRTRTIVGNRAEAQHELDAFVASVTDRSVAGSATTVGELLARWFELVSTSWSPATVRHTRSVLRGQLVPHLGQVQLGDLNAERIDAFYATLRVQGGQRGQPLAPGTIKRVHVVLHSALAQAMRWGWIWDNPADRAHRITAIAREPEPPTVEELTELLDHVRARDPAFHVLLVLAATTGARRAQLLALRWCDINLELGKVAFCGGWVEGEHGPVLTVTKTKRRHAVDLDDTATRLLGDHHARCRAATGGRLPDRNGFVFANDTDGCCAWKPNWATKTFLRYQREVGLRAFRLHDLRHFMATQMLDLGIAPTVVARRLDHRRVSTTMDFYSHVITGRDRFAADALANILQARRVDTR